jgi:tetratricopeptide (TPR) repeat protein
LHERFSDWLVSRRGDDAQGEILGYHLEQAHRYLIELGEEGEHAGELALRAGHLLAEAGRRADARLDAAATRSLLERATDLLPADDPDLPVLLELLGTATTDAGDFRRALEVERRAQAMAAAAGQRSVELRARMQELRIQLNMDPGLETGEVLAEAETAIAELAQLGDPQSLAKAWYTVTIVAAMRSDFALVEKASAERMAIARQAGLRRLGVWAAAGLTLGLEQGPVPVDEAITRAEEALAEFGAEQSGESHLALLYAYAGRHEEAAETIAGARRALLELGQRTLHAAMSMNIGWIALLAGDPERAESDLREGAEVLEAGGETGTLSTVAAVLAEVLCELDRDQEAEEWTHKSEQLTAPDDLLSQAMWRSTRAKLLARRGEAEALRLSAEAVDWIRRSDGLAFLGDALFARGQVLGLLGRPEEARRVLEEALAVYERKGVVPSIERTRDALAALQVAT